MEKMTRKEVETHLVELATEMGRIAKAYGTEGFLFCIINIEAGSVDVNNAYWLGGEDEHKPLKRYNRGIKFD